MYFVKPDGNGGIADAVNYEQELTAALTEAHVQAEAENSTEDEGSTEAVTVDEAAVTEALISSYTTNGYVLISDADYAKLTDTTAVPAYSIASDGSAIYQTYENQYLIKPDGKGSREDTKLAIEYTKAQVEEYLANGYFLIGDEDFQKLIGNADVAYSIASDGSLYETPAYEPTLEEVKTAKLTAAGEAFAAKRDAVRWVELPSGNTYGFDCAAEDISNFMAAYTPLLVAGGGSTGYKVWTDETTKAWVQITFEDMQEAYNVVRASQVEAYVWLKGKQAEIEAAMTVEEVEAITLDDSTTETAES